MAHPGNTISPGTTLAGDVRVLEFLGATPEGPLYQAEYPNGLRVAVLVLPPTGAGDQRATWERFARATEIQHPNVAAVYSVGEMEDGWRYAVLEQLDGEPLLSSRPGGRASALGEALDTALQVAAGLQAAHTAGVVHGNLSPRTVLLTRPPFGTPQVKLIGFQFDPVTRHAPIPSDEVSTGCASPERLSGSALDPRSDVFSLGALLHHLLTGTSPAHGRGVAGAPRVLRPVLTKALAPDPDHRYQTIAEMREALEQLVSVAIHPRRSKASLIGATMAGLVLVTGGIWLWSSNRNHTTEDPRLPGQARSEAPVRSPAAAPPAARREQQRPEPRAEQRSLSSAGGSAGRSSRLTQPRANPPGRSHREAAPSRESAGPVSRTPEEVSRTPEEPTASPQDKPGRATAPAPKTAVVDPAGDRRIEIRSEASEALGYVGEPAGSTPNGSAEGPGRSPAARRSAPSPAPPAPPAPAARAAPASPAGRARYELEQHQGLRLAMEDVLRIGLAEKLEEVRPGVLAVFLAPDGMSVPSATYNLQRLYLAYSASTRGVDEAVLELRRGEEAYGRFTREGLTSAASD